MKKYVLDTSALLNDPASVFAFPKADIIIPQIVLSELDRLKMMRADKGLIYRGREVSRILFFLSKQGKLSEGVKTEEGAIIKVVPADFPLGVPSGLNLKNSDDVILATVYTLTKEHPEEEITLVTSDLNMLVKAHTLGLKVEKMEEKPLKEGVFRRVFIRRGLQLATAVLVALIIALAGTLVYLWWKGTLPRIISPSVVEQEKLKIREEGYKKILQENPHDLQALVGLGNLYFQNKRYGQAVVHYHRALAIDPDDVRVRTSMGTAYLNQGYFDIALREYEKALEKDPEYAPAHYFSGLAFEKKGFSEEAVKRYRLYLELEPKGLYAEAARKRIDRLKK